MEIYEANDERRPLLSQQARATITPINLSEDKEQQKDALIDISNYYLVQEHENDIRYNTKKYTLLTLVSGSSVWLYGSIGGLAAGSDLILKILLITGGVSTNFCVTFNTSEGFIDYIKSQQAPAELKEYTRQMKSSKLEIAAIGSAAFLSAGPVTMAVFSNTDKLTALLITQATITQIDNTFIHTFPMLLIFQNPALRTLFLSPFLPMILGYRLFKTLCASEEEIRLNEHAETKARHHAQIKEAMIGTLEAARSQILTQSLQMNWRSFWSLKSNAKVPENLKNLNQLDGINSLLTIASYAPQTEQLTEKSLCKKITDFTLNSIIGSGMYLFGLGLSNAGSLGFYKNAYDSLDFIEDSTLQWSLTVPANLLLIVLVSYFAGRFFRHTLFDNMVSYFKGEYQAPQAFKRYPKTTLLLTGLSIFLARYSYGTALYLTQTHFNEPEFDNIRPTLYFCATYGMPVFTFKNTLEFILAKTVEFAKYFGEDDNKASAVLDSKILELENFIRIMDGDELESSLKLRTPGERKKLLRMSEDEFKKLIDHSVEEFSKLEPKIRITSPVSSSWAYTKII